MTQTLQSTGLRDTDIKSIRAAIARFPEVRKAVLFGSRARGDFRRGSDVDLAIWGDEDVSLMKTRRELGAWLNEESSMPYFFDVLEFARLSDEGLQREIEKHSIVLYEA